MKKIKNKRMSFQTEIVKGKCPTCDEITTLVGITSQFFRCMECGADLEQHVNGKISYLPIMQSRTDGGKPYVKEWKQKLSNGQTKFFSLHPKRLTYETSCKT
jgi:ribosomal protein S27E